MTSSPIKKDQKVLVIRFSSFGDIVFAMSVLPSLKRWAGERGEIDWLVRSDMSSVLSGQDVLRNIWSFSRKDGLLGLIKLSFKLRKEKYDLVYDAHSNLRSFVVRFILCTFSKSRLVQRPKERTKRYFLFKFRINQFDNWPYKAMISFLGPLANSLKGEWSLSVMGWKQTQNKVDTKGKIILVPSAAWEMKRWPIDYWKRLVSLLENKRFVILGGPEDSFCEEITKVAPNRVENMAGKLSLGESSAVVATADYVITADTGLAQVADLTGRKGITLIGPTAFGFPSMNTMKVVKSDLPCMPCSKDGSGNCSQEVYQKCMLDLTPDTIALMVRDTFCE